VSIQWVEVLIFRHRYREVIFAGKIDGEMEKLFMGLSNGTRVGK
jgi:hypothetical protein